MNNTGKTVATGGVSTATVIVIVLAILRWTHVINWSWIWVLAPWWGGIALALGIGVIAVLFMAIGWLWKKAVRK